MGAERVFAQAQGARGLSLDVEGAGESHVIKVQYCRTFEVGYVEAFGREVDLGARCSRRFRIAEKTKPLPARADRGFAK